MERGIRGQHRVDTFRINTVHLQDSDMYSTIILLKDQGIFFEV